MNKVDLFLDKYYKSELKKDLDKRGPFISMIIERYIKTVCENFSVSNQFINNLLKIKFEFIHKDKAKCSQLCEDFGKHLDKNEITMSIRYLDEDYLNYDLKDGLDRKYKLQAYKFLIETIHELNHALGFGEFCKLENNEYISLNKKEIKTLLENKFVYRLKSGFSIHRYSKEHKETAVEHDLLYEAYTEVLAHVIANSKYFNDINYVNINSWRVNSYSISFGYEPISSLVIMFSYIDKQIFANYFSTPSITKNVAYYTDIEKMVLPICTIDFKLDHKDDLIKTDKSYSEAILLTELVDKINNLIEYFKNKLLDSSLDEIQKKSIQFEIKNSLLNKNFWFNCYNNLDSNLLTSAFDNLTNLTISNNDFNIT